MSNGYDVTRMTEAAVVTDHVHGTIETEGPWLFGYDGLKAEGAVLTLIVPASAVVAGVPCVGRCQQGGTTGG